MNARSPTALAKSLAALFAAAMLAAAAVPAFAQAPTGVRISNINSASFTVSWTSVADAEGYAVIWTAPVGPTTRADDVRGAASVGTTHFVDFRTLLPGENYLVDVVTGGAIDNNGGQHYRVITGPQLAPRQPFTVYGRAARAGGRSPAGILVYLVVVDGDGSGSPGSSAPLSSVIRESDQGYWFANLNEARLPDLSAPFVSSNSDKVQIQLVGGPGQVLEATVPVAALTSPGAPLVVPEAPAATPPPTLPAAPASSPTNAPAASATPPGQPPTATPTSATAPSPPAGATSTATVAATTTIAATPSPTAIIAATPQTTGTVPAPLPSVPAIAPTAVAAALLPDVPATPEAGAPITEPDAPEQPTAAAAALPSQTPAELGLPGGDGGTWQWLALVLGLTGTLMLGGVALVAMLMRYRGY